MASLGAILFASGISAPFGSLFYGWLADKVGRRTALIAAVLNVSIATGAMALTPAGAWIYLLVCRFVVGFGTTGLYSVDITLMQEFTGSRKRGWITGLTTTMLPAGFLLGAFATPYIGVARPVRSRPAAGAADPLYPRLRARIAALVGAPRPA
jgi:MFS transporter, putative metabolite:H+ symporter